MGIAVCGHGLSRHDRSIQPPASQPESNASAGRASHRGIAVAASALPAGHRFTAINASFDRACSMVRCRLNRLSHIDIRTGEVIRRYEHAHPGAMLHVDVKKLGNIPDGGGWRFVGRARGKRNRHTTPEAPRNHRYQPVLGHAYVHTVIDDHSRVAYAEIHDDETAQTAIAVLRRAVGWFGARGVTVERVLSDNGACYKSYAWREACADLHITHKRTRAYRPQTNGKIERFHRTMTSEWAFARHYPNERTRRSALPAWLHTYNHHRQHSAIGKVPPFTRLTNVPGQYN
jgi:transposase InsO family protein